MSNALKAGNNEQKQLDASIAARSVCMFDCMRERIMRQITGKRAKNIEI